MNYVGDFTSGSIVYLYFNTFDSNNPSQSVTMTNFINTDVHIHKNDSLTQRNNAAGITVDVDVDGITGSHFIKIDTANNTVADFFVAGADYSVRIEGVTIDGGTINAVVGTFSIENRHVAGIMAKTTIATLASQTSFTLAVASSDDDAYNNCTIIVSDQVTAIQKAVGLISDYTGSSKTVTLAADPGIFTMAVGDNVSIIATSALAVKRLGAPAGASVSADIAAIVADTNELQGDDIPGLIAALNDISSANVNTEVSDVLKTDTIAENSQAKPTATPTFEVALMYIYMALRNKVDVTAALKEFHNDAGTVIWKKALSDDGTTYSEAEGATGP